MAYWWTLTVDCVDYRVGLSRGKVQFRGIPLGALAEAKRTAHARRFDRDSVAFRGRVIFVTDNGVDQRFEYSGKQLTTNEIVDLVDWLDCASRSVGCDVLMDWYDAGKAAER